MNNFKLIKEFQMNACKLTAVQYKAIQEGAQLWLNSDKSRFTCRAIREHICTDDVLYSRIFRVMHELFKKWLKATGKTEPSIYTSLFINKYHKDTEEEQYKNAVKETRTEFMTWIVNTTNTCYINKSLQEIQWELDLYRKKRTEHRHITRTTYTIPDRLWQTLIRDCLSIEGSWHTYESELVNMYLTQTTEVVLSLRTGKFTVYEYNDGDTYV